MQSVVVSGRLVSRNETYRRMYILHLGDVG